jgi:hypothetical protein
VAVKAARSMASEGSWIAIAPFIDNINHRRASSSVQDERSGVQEKAHEALLHPLRTCPTTERPARKARKLPLQRMLPVSQARVSLRRRSVQRVHARRACAVSSGVSG